MSPRVPHTQTHEHFDFISIDRYDYFGGGGGEGEIVTVDKIATAVKEGKSL